MNGDIEKTTTNVGPTSKQKAALFEFRRRLKENPSRFTPKQLAAEKELSRRWGISEAVGQFGPEAPRGFISPAPKAPSLSPPAYERERLLGKGPIRGDIEKVDVESIPGPYKYLFAAGRPVVKAAQEITQPESVALLAVLGKAPIWLQRLGSAGFAYLIGKELPEQWKAFKEARTPAAKTEAAASALLNVTMGGLAAKHAVKGAKPITSKKDLKPGEVRELKPEEVEVIPPKEPVPISPRETRGAIPAVTPAEQPSGFTPEGEPVYKPSVAGPRGEYVGEIPPTRVPKSGEPPAQKMAESPYRVPSPEKVMEAQTQRVAAAGKLQTPNEIMQAQQDRIAELEDTGATPEMISKDPILRTLDRRDIEIRKGAQSLGRVPEGETTFDIEKAFAESFGQPKAATAKAVPTETPKPSAFERKQKIADEQLALKERKLELAKRQQEEKERLVEERRKEQEEKRREVLAAKLEKAGKFTKVSVEKEKSKKAPKIEEAPITAETKLPITGKEPIEGRPTTGAAAIMEEGGQPVAARPKKFYDPVEITEKEARDLVAEVGNNIKIIKDQRGGYDRAIAVIPGTKQLEVGGYNESKDVLIQRAKDNLVARGKENDIREGKIEVPVLKTAEVAKPGTVKEKYPDSLDIRKGIPEGSEYFKPEEYKDISLEGFKFKKALIGFKKKPGERSISQRGIPFTKPETFEPTFEGVVLEKAEAKRLKNKIKIERTKEKKFEEENPFYVSESTGDPGEKGWQLAIEELAKERGISVKEANRRAIENRKRVQESRKK